MSPPFFSRESRTLQAERVVHLLQEGDVCNECLMRSLELESRTSFHARLRDVALLVPSARLLQHPSNTVCSNCKREQRTVYTLATRLAPRDAQAAVGRGIASLRQDLGSFLTILENRSGHEDPSGEVTVFSPLFVGTNWAMWELVHRAIHDKRVLSGKYGGHPVTLAPLHLWWAQGSWYLMAHRLEALSSGRGWRKEPDGMRSGLKLARLSGLREEPDIAMPTGMPLARRWLGGGDWLFRGDARENRDAVIVLGSRLLHYFRERLESGMEDDLKLWGFSDPMPGWVGRVVPGTLRESLATDPVTAMAGYRRGSNPDGDPQTANFLEGDAPAAIVAFPYPYGALDSHGRRVGEFEAARRILSWGGEAVALGPTTLVNRVRELARIAWERQTSMGG